MGICRERSQDAHQTQTQTQSHTHTQDKTSRPKVKGCANNEEMATTQHNTTQTNTMNTIPSFSSSSSSLSSLFFNTGSYGRIRTRPISPILSSTQKTLSSSLTDTSQLQQKLESFQSWLHEKGVFTEKNSIVKPKLCDVSSSSSSSQRLGLFAHKRSISEGEETLSVPQELWMSVSVSHSSTEIGSFCRNCRPWVALALFLLFEKNKKNSSVWRAYIDILPPTLDSPLFWYASLCYGCIHIFLFQSLLQYYSLNQPLLESVFVMIYGWINVFFSCFRFNQSLFWNPMFLTML